jgi:hypothetical protein
VRLSSLPIPLPLSVPRLRSVHSSPGRCSPVWQDRFRVNELVQPGRPEISAIRIRQSHNCSRSRGLPVPLRCHPCEGQAPVRSGRHSTPSRCPHHDTTRHWDRCDLRRYALSGSLLGRGKQIHAPGNRFPGSCCDSCPPWHNTLLHCRDRTGRSPLPHAGESHCHGSGLLPHGSRGNINAVHLRGFETVSTEPHCGVPRSQC